MTQIPDFPHLWTRRLALSAFALAVSFVLPAAQASVAMAQETKPDTSRLVSIGGAITEIIYALGEEKRLVARDSTSLYPEAALKLPDVGYMRALSPEGVIAVNPTAIVAVEGSGPPEALAVLKSANIPFETIPESYDRNGIVGKITAVGKFLGVEDKAKVLADQVGTEIDTIEVGIAKRPEGERKRVLFILSMQGGKIMAAGVHTAADGIIKLSGAINATDGFPGYKPVTDEAIIEAKPDAIVLMSRGGGHGVADEEVLSHPALSLTPAAEKKAILRIDGLHALGFGPRTASAIRDLNGAIYGKSGHVSQ